MAALLTLKSASPQLCYQWASDTPGDVSAALTQEQLVADLSRPDQVALKAYLERITTDDAWTALGKTLDVSVTQGTPGSSRIKLVANWTTVDGVRQLVLSGKASNYSFATVEIRPKK